MLFSVLEILMCRFQEIDTCRLKAGPLIQLLPVLSAYSGFNRMYPILTGLSTQNRIHPVLSKSAPNQTTYFSRFYSQYI